MTYRDFFEVCFLNLQYFAMGESISDDQMQKAVNCLNGLVDTLGAQRLSMGAVNRWVFPLTSNKQNYSLAPGNTLPDWDGPVPNTASSIEHAGIMLPGTPDYEKPIRILSDTEYQNIRIKTFGSTYVTSIYNNRANPEANIYCYPNPSVATNIVLYMAQKLAKITMDNLADDMVYADGAYEMLLWGTTVRLAPLCSVTVQKFMTDNEDKFTQIFFSSNQPDLNMRCDTALTGRRHRGGFNIYTGGYGR